MTEMSRAIRETIEKHSPDGTLKALPAKALEEFAEIVTAFSLDLKDEVKRRQRGET